MSTPVAHEVDPKPARELIGGRYVLGEPVGTGAWANVYEAQDTKVRRRVAIKVLQEPLRHRPEVVERFEREARTNASVRHPNVVSVFDVGTLEDGSPYLVMELLEGEDLGRRLAWGPLPIAEVAELAVQVLHGLCELAQQRLVHRDIKPQNIMLHRIGARTIAKIVDFGISRAELPGDGALTHAGMLLGTPLYMAPEQLRQEAVDCRTDVYGLGAVLYECITGRPPFEADATTEILASILRDPLVPPSAMRPDCPLELERIVMRALARDPAERYGHPREMAEELMQWIKLDRRREREEHTAPIELRVTRSAKRSRETACGELRREQATRLRRGPARTPLALVIAVAATLTSLGAVGWSASACVGSATRAATADQ